VYQAIPLSAKVDKCTIELNAGYAPVKAHLGLQVGDGHLLSFLDYI
jgi:hypothetical protein